MNKKSDHVQYSTPAILVGPADVEFDLLLKFQQSAMPLIAADGGANQLLAQGINPDIIIGDFDSIDTSLKIAENTICVRIEEQDTSDFDKCLYSIEAPLYLAFGFIGDRFDHTLASLHTLVKYSQQKDIILIGTEDFSFVVEGKIRLNVETGQCISVFPIAPIEFASSVGLEYSLYNLPMEIGTQIGTSNKTTANRVVITPANQHVQTPYLITLPHASLEQIISQSY